MESPDNPNRPMVDESIRMALDSVHGRIAMLWALNLLETEPGFSADPRYGAFLEGKRHAAKEALDYLRADHHKSYQLLMSHLHDIENHNHMLDTQPTDPLEEKV